MASKNQPNGKPPAKPSPDERYEDFARENERWDRKIQEDLRELDEVVEKSGAVSEPDATPA